MKNLEKHPCFNEGAKHKYGRLHIPVAPKCNVQCNFCNRKYDCANESRPGVTSSILSPQQALRYVDRIMEKNANISVVGIAGPGDAFANAEETLESMRLIREKYPDMLLCLATNGLELLEHVDKVAKIGVSHVTITVNAVDPKIGAQIYSWVRYKKRMFRREEGAKILWERQLAAMKKLKEKNVVLKVNSVVIPGVNDHHILDIAKTVSELGADIFNAIPIIPAADTPFEKIQKPSGELMNLIQKDSGEYLPQMTHCKRCRADAVGLLGETMTNDASKLLSECASLPILPEQNRPYVAVASMEGLLVNQHLGEAGEILVYAQDGESYTRIDTRKTPAPGCGDERWMELAGILHDCRAILVSGVGDSPKKILKKSGMAVYEVEGLIEDGLDSVFKGLRIVPISKKFKCGESCTGTGQGCG